MKEIRSRKNKITDSITTDSPIAFPQEECLDLKNGNIISSFQTVENPIIEETQPQTHVEYIHDEEIYKFCKETDIAVDSILIGIDDPSTTSGQIALNGGSSVRSKNEQQETVHNVDSCRSVSSSCSFKLLDKKPYKCPHCDMRFRVTTNISRHIKYKHSLQAMYKCSQCDYRSVEPYKLKQHMLIHTDDRKFKCDICYQSFKRKEALGQHMNIHTGKKPYKCNVCSETFVQCTQLKRHTKKVHEEVVFECEKCPKKFLKKIQLVDHMKLHENTNTFHCLKCKSVFKTEHSLKLHEQSNHVTFQCKSCSMTFTRKESLKSHIKLQHENACKACCDLSDIPDKNNYRQHTCNMRTKKLKCLHCDSSFVNTLGLKQHVLEQHPEKLDIKCEYCDYITWNKVNLRVHLANCHPDKKFKCENCTFVTWIKVKYKEHCDINHHPKKRRTHRKLKKRKRKDFDDKVSVKRPRSANDITDIDRTKHLNENTTKLKKRHRKENDSDVEMCESTSERGIGDGDVNVSYSGDDSKSDTSDDQHDVCYTDARSKSDTNDEEYEGEGNLDDKDEDFKSDTSSDENDGDGSLSDKGEDFKSDTSYDENDSDDIMSDNDEESESKSHTSEDDNEVVGSEKGDLKFHISDDRDGSESDKEDQNSDGDREDHSKPDMGDDKNDEHKITIEGEGDDECDMDYDEYEDDKSVNDAGKIAKINKLSAENGGFNNLIDNNNDAKIENDNSINDQQYIENDCSKNHKKNPETKVKDNVKVILGDIKQSRRDVDGKIHKIYHEKQIRNDMVDKKPYDDNNRSRSIEKSYITAVNFEMIFNKTHLACEDKHRTNTDTRKFAIQPVQNNPCSSKSERSGNDEIPCTRAAVSSKPTKKDDDSHDNRNDIAGMEEKFRNNQALINFENRKYEERNCTKNSSRTTVSNDNTKYSDILHRAIIVNLDDLKNSPSAIIKTVESMSGNGPLMIEVLDASETKVIGSVKTVDEETDVEVMVITGNNESVNDENIDDMITIGNDEPIHEENIDDMITATENDETTNEEYWEDLRQPFKICTPFKHPVETDRSHSTATSECLQIKKYEIKSSKSVDNRKIKNKTNGNTETSNNNTETSKCAEIKKHNHKRQHYNATGRKLLQHKIYRGGKKLRKCFSRYRMLYKCGNCSSKLYYGIKLKKQREARHTFSEMKKCKICDFLYSRGEMILGHKRPGKLRNQISRFKIARMSTKNKRKNMLQKNKNFKTFKSDGFKKSKNRQSKNSFLANHRTQRHLLEQDIPTNHSTDSDLVQKTVDLVAADRLKKATSSSANTSSIQIINKEEHLEATTELASAEEIGEKKATSKQFLRNVNKVFKCGTTEYQTLFSTLEKFRSERMDFSGVIKQVFKLLDGHPDLLDQFIDLLTGQR